MLLNRVEKALMNNPVRAAVQRGFEARRLLALGGPMKGGVALEVGCGRGVGTEIVLEHFGADRVDAFDLDPEMVELARRRLARHAERVRLWVGAAERIDAQDGQYDAVFDFGIIHHVPDWPRAIAEIRRVLRPGGRLYAEEALAGLILSPIVRRVLEHPSENRFDARRFRDELARQGFEVRATRDMAGLFAWFIADRPGA